MMKISVYSSVLLLSFLSACIFVKPYEGTPITSPDSYRFSDQQEVEEQRLKTEEEKLKEILSWWELFNDPYLDTLIVTALENNQDVQIATQRIEQARYQQQIATKQMRPLFNVSKQAQRGNFIQNTPNSESFNLYAGFLSTAWEIDFWGKLRSQNKVAKANLLGSEYSKRAIQISLISDVAINYFKLLEFKALLDISENTLSSRDSSTLLIQNRFDQGIVAEIDLNQAQIQQAIAAAAIPVYKRQVYLQENALSVLLGEVPRPIEPELDLKEQKVILEIPEGMPSDLLARRPDLLFADQQVEAQHYQVGVAKGNRIPAINLTSVLGMASTQLSTLTDSWPAWNVAASIVGPIFQWGILRNQVSVQEYLLKEQMLSYEKSVLTAFREVEDALISISTLKEEIIAREMHVTAAGNAEMLSRVRYDKGVTSYLEFLESQRQAFDARQNLAQTRQQILSAYVQLYKALGGGWITPEEKEEALEAVKLEEEMDEE